MYRGDCPCGATDRLIDREDQQIAAMERIADALERIAANTKPPVIEVHGLEKWGQTDDARR